MKIKFLLQPFIVQNRNIKISLFLLFVCVLQLMATNTEAQNAIINVRQSNLSIKQLINEIEKQTDYLVVFRNQDIDISKVISFRKHTGKVSDYLDEVYKNTDVSYVFENNYITLYKKTVGVDQDKKQITGEVTDQYGDPVIGANIVEKGTINGVITDRDGNFTLSVTDKSVIQVKFIGYIAQEFVVDSKNYFNVVLREDLQNLDEVVVIGYSTNTKRSIISSISTVDASELKNLPLSNITEGLAGRSPGLIVKANGGGLNAQSKITIRGGETPLVVIDGIIRSYEDFVAIQPDDIISLIILKDASATAAYGSRATNGILQITTKRGQVGQRPTIELNISKEYSQPTVLPKKLGSFDRASLVNMALQNDKLDNRYTQEELQKFRDQSDPWNYPDTDWQKAALKNFAESQKYNFSMSGGSEHNQYYVSLGHLDQGSLYRSDTHDFKRTNMRINEVSSIKSIGLKITTQFDGYYETLNSPNIEYWALFSHIQNRMPWQLAYNDYGLPYNTVENPVAETSPEAGYYKTVNKVIAGLLSAEWEVPWISGLRAKLTANYRNRNQRKKDWNRDAPKYALESVEPSATGLPNLTKRAIDQDDYSGQFILDYNTVIKETHYISVLAGYECQYHFSSEIWGSRDSYQFDINQIGAGPASSSKNGGPESESGRAGYVGQLKYNYKNKYFAEASMRYDGSDLFPKDKRWGTFYSGSLGWSLADEKFWEKLKEKNIFNTFKIRASYGEIGIDNWADPYELKRYAYLPSYTYVDRSYVVGGVLQPGFKEGALPSSNISWFTTKQTDIGIDFSSLGNKLYGSADYFYYATTGFLYAPSALDIGYVDPLGISVPKVKTDGEHRREGWEFQLGYRDRTGDFSYDISFNFTYFDQLWAKNPQESLESIKNPWKRQMQQVGYYTTGYNTYGFYSGSDDAYNNPKHLTSTQLVSGDIKYVDFNGDGVIDAQDQVRIGKSSFPRGIYGIPLKFKYRAFSLDLLFQGSTRFDMYAGSTIMMSDGLTGTFPVYKFQEDFWTPENTDAKFPRLISSTGTNGRNNHTTSNFWLIDGTYFRMKDFRISYDFKNKLLKKTDWLSRLNLSLSGQNIFTISKSMKYGLDPENSNPNNYAYPVGRSFSVNLNIGF